ncbi:MAG: DEAD/DEAH box helicase [Candidatus Izemoplasmatales bacterium]|nr:DEAD/DEAH box helicase [Candidatus Izemoplasmatales bacterium]
MNNVQIKQYFMDKELSSYQAKFAVSFLQNENEPYIQLISSAGTGKTTVAIAIIKYLIEEKSNQRFLVLGPVGLLTYYKSKLSNKLSSSNLIDSVIIVDRNTYLEMESKVSTHENPWPSPAIILMSMDLAKREDMIRNLCKTKWDLVVVDESHLLTGKRKSILEQLIKTKAINRCLCLSAMPVEPISGVILKNEKWQNSTNWKFPNLYKNLEKSIQNINYDITTEEKDLLFQLESFAEELVKLRPYGKFLSESILQRASSSLYSLEESLRRLLDSMRSLRNKLAHHVLYTLEDLKNTQQQLMRDLGQEAVEVETNNDVTINLSELMELYEIAEMLLDRVEEIKIDSKMKSLVSYLKRKVKNKQNCRICVLSSFKSTVEYLTSSLRKIEISSIYQFTAELSVEDKESLLHQFKQQGGILIASDASLKGISLEYIEECINYDLPRSPTLIYIRLSRFIKPDQKNIVRMFSLKEKAKSIKSSTSLKK